MNISFRPAVRENVGVMIGLAGPSGAGKTFSAHRLARGLAGPDGKVFMIDTENRRGLHYADQFDFLHGELAAPFTSARYVDALLAAKEAAAKVIIVDSMSHEHEGPGGILEQHEAELKRMAGDDWSKRERVKFTAWIRPKAEHNKFVNTALQLNLHMIFCFRAKDKLMMVKNARGKNEPVSIGWQPICSDRFEYEMAAMLVLPPNSNGVPDYEAKATKLQAQHRAIFKPERQIDENMGAEIAGWAAGGSQRQPATETATSQGGNGEKLLQRAEEVAAEGYSRLESWWQQLSAAQAEFLQPHHERLRQKAIDADTQSFADQEGIPDNRPVDQGELV